MPSTDAVPESVRGATPHVVRALAQWTGDLAAAEELAFEALQEVAARQGDETQEELATLALARAAQRRGPGATRTTGPRLEEAELDPDGVPSGLDDRTALLFVCCDPRLVEDDRLALSLRLVCGLSPSRIAEHSGIPPGRIAVHLDRARRTIATARGGFAIPTRADRADRLGTVLACVAEMFSVVHRIGIEHPGAIQDLGHEALWLCDGLVDMHPGDTEVRGLRASLLLALARATTAVDADGAVVPVEQADRSLWDARFLRAGIDDAAFAMTGGGRFALEAAVSRLVTVTPTSAGTDRERVVQLLEVLAQVSPSGRVESALLLARSHTDTDPDRLDAIELALRDLAAGLPGPAGRDALLALCDLQWRRGRRSSAAAGYRAALELVQSPAVRRFCERRAAVGA